MSFEGLHEGGAMGGQSLMSKHIEGPMGNNFLCLAGVTEFLKLDGSGGALSILFALNASGMGWFSSENIPGIFNHHTHSFGQIFWGNTATLFPGAGATPAPRFIK